RTAPRGRARRARRLRGRVHAHWPSGRDRARADSSRPERHRPGDDLPARRRRPHRDDDPALPDRGHAARAGGAARMTVTVHMHGSETAGWNYIERIEIRDMEQYQKDLASPAGQELLRQLYENYLERPKNVFFTTEPIGE